MKETTPRSASASVGGPPSSDGRLLALGAVPTSADGGLPALAATTGFVEGDDSLQADADCRDWLWRFRYSPDGRHAFCSRCGRLRRFHRLRSRPSYSCDSCGHQLSPTHGTIFEKSRTPLHLWFHAIVLVAEATGPVSGRRLGEVIGVAPRTAQRMLARIDAALTPASPGTVPRAQEGDARGLATRIVQEYRGGTSAWKGSGLSEAGAAAPLEAPSGQPLGANRRGREANKQRILSATCTVILEQGMAGVRVSDIAREAGLSTAIIHYYFATKDDVLLAAMKWQNQRASTRRAAIVASQVPPVVKFARFLEEAMPPSGFGREEALIRFDLWGKAMREPTYADVLRPLRDEWRRQIATLIEEGIASGDFHLDTPFEQVLEELTAVLDSYSLQYTLGYHWMSAERLWELLSEYAARHLGVRRERFVEARTGT